MVPAVGLEPTRVISSTDFESVTSAIPSHRHCLGFHRGSIISAFFLSVKHRFLGATDSIVFPWKRMKADLSIIFYRFSLNFY